MKKIEWLIAILFIGMGIMCLTLSALSFQQDIFLLMGSFIKNCLVGMVIMGILILLIFHWIKQRKR